MPKKKTNEDFIAEVFQLVGDEYIFLEKYINSQTKIKVLHKKCNNEYNLTPNSFLSKGSRCPYCSGKKRRTNKDFIKEVFNEVQNEYTFLDNYINTDTKLHVIHNICGHTYEVTPYHFLKTKTRCPKCKGTIKKTDIDFKNEVYQKVEDEYTFLDIYKNYHTKLKVVHNVCKHEYKVTPAMFLSNNSRCPLCYKNNLKTNEEFILQANKVDDEYTFLEKYINSHVKIKIKHDICGFEYYVSPTNFLHHRSKCPECSLKKSYSRGEKELFVFIEKNINDIIIPNERKVLNGKEIDIYIPSKNIGIEFDGVYWHSTKFKNKYNLLYKTQQAKDKNINLIHIFDDEWTFKRIAVENHISNILGFLEQILINKCKIKEIDNIKEFNNFIKLYNITTYLQSDFAYGIYYNDKLISILSINKILINNDFVYSISKYITTKNITNQLNILVKFAMQNLNINNIYISIDLRLDILDFYIQQNFKIIEEFKPISYCIKNGIRNIDKNNIEEYKIYDCGSVLLKK